MRIGQDLFGKVYSLIVIYQLIVYNNGQKINQKSFI